MVINREYEYYWLIVKRRQRLVNRESCKHKTATAMALGKDIPCSTPYGEHWKELIELTSFNYAKANKR